MKAGWLLLIIAALVAVTFTLAIETVRQKPAPLTRELRTNPSSAAAAE